MCTDHTIAIGLCTTNTQHNASSFLQIFSLFLFFSLMCILTRVYTYVGVCACVVCSHVRVYMLTCIYVHVCLHACVYTCVCVHSYVCGSRRSEEGKETPEAAVVSCPVWDLGTLV